MSDLKSFLKKENGSQNTDPNRNNGRNGLKEEKISSNQLELEEDESDSYSRNKNESEEESEGLEDDRMCLSDIFAYVKRVQEKKKKRENERKNDGKKSFLNKKRKLNYEPIKYDAIKGDIHNRFCPSLKELNEFFAKCQITASPLEDSLPKLKESKSQDFDVEKWMKENNIQNGGINGEELYIYSKGIKIREEAEVLSLYKESKEKAQVLKNKKFDNPQIKYNYDMLQTVVYSKILSFEQKEFLVELFEEMNKIDIKDIEIEKYKEGNYNKLELVLDLDNTCIFSIFYDINKLLAEECRNNLSKKETLLMDFEYNGKTMHNVMIIRNGLKEFVKYVEPLCNFYISTLGAEEYGKAIQNILELSYGITFLGFKGKNKYKVQAEKKLSDLSIKKENTVIIDDSVNVWSQDSENVIISKFFYDEEAASAYQKKDNPNNLNEKKLFLQKYKTFYYYSIRNDNWKSQSIIKKEIVFYQYKKGNPDNYNQCFSAEYLYSQKAQFLYLKNVLKQIYLLRFVYDLEIPLAIKVIRMSTLANMIFLPKLNNSQKTEILKEIIISCGGIIYNNEPDDMNEKVYLVVSPSNINYDEGREKIRKYLEKNPFMVLINEKFILDSFYFMTNLKAHLNDPEYTCSI
jgi:hypothetical protein